jgi:hypothetical protein
MILAITWWNGLALNERIALCIKYHPKECFSTNPINKLLHSPFVIQSIYKSEKK